MIYKNTPEIEEIYLGSTAIEKIFNGSDLVFETPYSGLYIRFSDPDVKSIIVNEYGDTSIGKITYTQAEEVTTFVSGNDTSTNPFYHNYHIDSFDEFAYFTGVTSIGSYTFANCYYMTRINIPAYVTSIGNSAFHGCQNLKHITIPNTVTSIGEDAFSDCSRLTSANIPTAVTSISEWAFASCFSLTSIIIPTSVTSIGGNAFCCCGLTSVTIPASVTSIGNSAFSGCQSLTSITCEATTPPTLVMDGTLEWKTFYDTNNCPIYVPAASVDTYKAATGWSNYASRIQAKTIVFADPDVKSIIVEKYGSNGEITEEQAAAVTTFMSGTNTTNNPFYKNTDVGSFDEFAYFTGITAIGNYTFNGCSNMTSITIPENVTSIGTNAFSGCTYMTSVTIPQTVNEINGGAFTSCKNLTSINIPNGVTSIGNSTFYHCESLMSITIPSGVTSIGSTAFSGCYKLTSLTIPASVTSIGASAFSSCIKLTSITCEATTPPTLATTSSDTYTTFNSTNNCPIYVPAASVSLYKETEGWSSYASRIRAKS